jgi:hypothetical protein
MLRADRTKPKRWFIGLLAPTVATGNAVGYWTLDPYAGKSHRGQGSPTVVPQSLPTHRGRRRVRSSRSEAGDGVGKERGRVGSLRPDAGDGTRRVGGRVRTPHSHAGNRAGKGRGRIRTLRPDAGDRAGRQRGRIRSPRPDTGDRPWRQRGRIGRLQADAGDGSRGRRSLRVGRHGSEELAASDGDEKDDDGDGTCTHRHLQSPCSLISRRRDPSA